MQISNRSRDTREKSTWYTFSPAVHSRVQAGGRAVHKITQSTSLNPASIKACSYIIAEVWKGERDPQSKVDFEKFFRAQGFIFNEPLL